MSRNVLIAGAGIAGLNAAKAARDNDPDCIINMIEQSSNNTYTRTRLPEYISGEIDSKTLFAYNDDWYKNNRINLIKDTKILDLNTADKIIITEKNNYSFDSLVITTGSISNVPKLPGIDLKNVFSIRTINDADSIKNFPNNNATCSIIGGGLLGLEIAWSIKQLGFNVNILDHNNRLLSKQIDEKCSQLLLDSITAKGINVFLNASTKVLTGTEKVESIQLADNREIPTDIVVFSAGVTSFVSPFTSSGITIEKAICVDNKMKTNIDGIYAAGDVASFNGKNYSLWTIAMAQGKIAGANAVGKNVEYVEISPFTNLKIKGISVFSIGNVFDKECSEVFSLDEDQNKYIKLLIKDNIISAGMSFGEPSVVLKIKKAVEQKTILPEGYTNMTVSDIINKL